MATKQLTFAKLVEELEAIVQWFESDTIDLDQALVKFERGLALSKELEDKLKSAKQHITKLTKSKTG